MQNFGVTHESGKLKRVLVHHPGKELELANQDPVAHHFDQPVDIKRFRSDHLELLERLKEVGVEVIRVREILEDNPKALEQSLECPNLVFVRDSSTVTKKGAFLFRMGLPTRRQLSEFFTYFFVFISYPRLLQKPSTENFMRHQRCLV